MKSNADRLLSAFGIGAAMIGTVLFGKYAWLLIQQHYADTITQLLKLF